MGRSLDQSEAIAIAKKIGAVIEPQGPHQTATLWIDGALILTFGIRHSKKSDQGHLVGENHPLRLNLAKAKALASCTLSREAYFQHLTDRGIIPKKPDPGGVGEVDVSSTVVSAAPSSVITKLDTQERPKR